MKTILLIGYLIVIALQPDNVKAQGSLDTLRSPYLVLVNNQSNQQVAELQVGNWVKLKLTNATKIKGIIMQVDTASFTVSNKRVRFDEIIKISTKKRWVQGVGIGLMAAGTIWGVLGISASESLDGWLDVETPYVGTFIVPGLIATGAGMVMALPNYRDIGKYSLIVIDSSQNPLVGRIDGN